MRVGYTDSRYSALSFRCKQKRKKNFTCPRCGSRLFPLKGEFINSFNCVICSVIFDRYTWNQTTHKELFYSDKEVIKCLGTE
jgi:transcription elongation factor Elf1